MQRKVSRRRSTRSNLLLDGFGCIVSACGSVRHSLRRSRVRSAAPYLSDAAADPWDGIGRTLEETVSDAGPTQRAFARRRPKSAVQESVRPCRNRGPRELEMPRRQVLDTTMATSKRQSRLQTPGQHFDDRDSGI